MLNDNKADLDFFVLRKAAKKSITDGKKYKIAILGDFATQFLTIAIKGYGRTVNLDLDIYEADYNQIDAELSNEFSGLYQFSPQAVLVIQSSTKLLQKFYRTNNETRSDFASDYIQYINSIVESLLSKGTKVVFSNFTEYDDSVYGNYANKHNLSFLFQLRKINYELMQYASEKGNFFINDVARIFNHIGEKTAFSYKNYVNSDMLFSLDFTALIAKNVVDIIRGFIGMTKKCLILDLDNTLWGGVIGDDGINNIHIGDYGIGKAFTELQLWIRELKTRGIIIAICSKNYENVAKEPFISHPEMTLRLEDVSIFVANWESKVDNIRYIQSVLNIGFDSMVFLDDNPYERDLVRNNIPQILVPELPEDPSLYLPFLRKENIFDTVIVSSEDKQRTKKYQEEAERIKFKASYVSEDEYLENLKMFCEVRQNDLFDISRVAQLTQRSNQFNVRTIRYTDNDLAEYIKNGQWVIFSFRLTDKFGDYGLISAVILKYISDYAFIDTWVMSCRVLKRGVEQFIINELIRFAMANNLKYIKAEYLPTEKNIMVSNLYSSLGFEQENGFWILRNESFKLHKVKIYDKN